MFVLFMSNFALSQSNFFLTPEIMLDLKMIKVADKENSGLCTTDSIWKLLWI